MEKKISNQSATEQAITLPTCQIWQKKMPPLRWTAWTMGFHASTCSGVQMPGVSGYPCAVAETPVASAMRRPPLVARCE